MRAIRHICLVLLVVIVFAPSMVQAAWYDANWLYRKAVTIDGSQVAGGPHNDFPVLISITDTDLSAARADGWDLLFTDSDGTTKLDHEVESFDNGTGTLVAWVRIPAPGLTFGSDKVIYLYYDYATVPTDQQNAPGVWSNGYEAVYHLHSNFFDSTANSRNATNNSSANIAGQVADGQDFTPVSDLQLGAWSVSGTQLTMQAWARFDDFNQDDPRVVSKATTGSAQDHVFMLGLSGSGEQYLRMRIKTGTLDASGTTTLADTANPLTINTWYLVAGTYDGSNMQLLRNGSSVISTPKTGNLRLNSWEIWAGNNPNNASTNWAAMDGKLDEIRISSVARSPEWLTTEYNNQNAPGTFIMSVGTEEDVVGVTVSDISGDTDETGTTATFTVVLNSQPSADVTIPIVSLDLTEGTVSAANLTFTNVDWDTAQTVTVTGVDDVLIDGDITYTVEVGDPASVADTNFDDLTNADTADVSVTNINDDGMTVSGTIFEDVNYGGGTGRNLAAANADAGSFTLERGGVTVELYDDPAGSYISNAVTAADGTYSFTTLMPANYTVRVVNSTVTSVRTGSNGSELAVQTFRSDGASEGAGTGATKVGGEQPVDVDAPANDTTQTLANLQAPVGQYTQSIITVDASGGDVTGVDFGFNFDTIVNTNGSGQGSLRQFILNANLLTDNASLAQNGLTAGAETSIFMIPSATDPLGRPADPNYNGSGNGEFTIQPGTALPVISDPVVLDATTQTGFGGSPIIEVTNGPGDGITISANNSTFRGFIVNNFSGGIGLVVNGNFNLIAGNWIGTNAAGNAAGPGNGQDGIAIFGDSNTVGGSNVADRNVVSGNGDEGIDVEPVATGNVIIGNYVGTDDSGSVAITNGSGGWSGGILLDGGGNRIGGNAPGEGNLISGNNPYGILLHSSSNQVLGNLIGTDATGTANLANTSDGITVDGSNNVIGGTVANADNKIAFNGEDGIEFENTAGTGNTISGNSIFSNIGIGIDLDDDGVTTNDTGPPHDIDTGPNNLQNYPVLTFASTGGGNTIIAGTFNSIASTTFTLEFFSSTVADGTGYGEGEVYLGSDTVATDVSGNASFIVVLPLAVALGDVITATATDPGNNTSEFSNAVTVSDGALIEFEVATASDAEATGGNIPNLIVTGNVGAGETIDVTVTGGSATPGALNDYTNTVTVTIPAGSYTNAVATPISLTINDDAAIEGNEDIQFTLANPIAGLIIGDANVDTSTQSTHTYTIKDGKRCRGYRRQYSQPDRHRQCGRRRDHRCDCDWRHGNRQRHRLHQHGECNDPGGQLYQCSGHPDQLNYQRRCHDRGQ
jgi:hypothetical protein